MALVYVDDDPTISWLMDREWCQAFPDTPIRTALTPEEALAAVESLGDTIAAVVVDWRLNGVTSENLVRELRRRWPRLLIIATSAVSAPRQLAALEKAGANRFLEKDLSVHVFVQRLAREIAVLRAQRDEESP
jgi:DNA-binding NarL/FixJ family response regulator